MNLPLPVKGVVPVRNEGITQSSWALVGLAVLAALSMGVCYFDAKTTVAVHRHFETLCVMNGGTAFRRLFAPDGVPAVLCIDNRVLSVPERP